MNTLHSLSQAFAHTLQQYAPELHDPSVAQLTLNVDPTRQQFGDFSSNAPLILAKMKQQNPRAVAQAIIAAFQHPAVARCEIAGPGFINITLTPFAYTQILTELVEQGAHFFKLEPHEAHHNFSIEFVSANPTGPLHIGHGRNGIIGDVLTRIARFLGHQVTPEFYINDAGSQMVNLARSVRARCLQELGREGIIPEEGYQGAYIIDIARECLHEYGEKVLDEPDTFFATYAKNKLLAQQQETLAAYHISFDVWFSELTLHESGGIADVLKRLTDAGYLYEHEGALWFKAAELGDEKDRVVRRSSGEYTYVAADIAYLWNKVERGFDRLVIVVGQDHHGYVARLKAALQALGQNPDMLHVLLYQVVTLKNEGEVLRLSKRAGRIISLADVIDTVGSDVARFFFLHRKADAHLDFDVALACKHTDENPVHYLHYAYVRTLSILEKAAQFPEFKDFSTRDAAGLTQAEQLLIKKIISLNAVLRTSIEHYQAHTLTYYILELANLFHSYYAAHRVIDQNNPPLTRARLLLIDQLRSTFKLCLELLGLSTPERM